MDRKQDMNIMKSSESLEYFGSAVSNQNCLNEETESRLNSENASYRLVQNNLFTYLIFKREKG
jgi:hypothetical protein